MTNSTTYTVRTLATELGCSAEDLQALIDGANVDTDEIFVEDTDTLTGEWVESLTNAIEDLSAEG